MGDLSSKIDLGKAISYGDDLVQLLRSETDSNNLKQCFEYSKALQSQIDSDYDGARSLLQDYEKRIDLCKQKIDVARSEAVPDTEIELLQTELEKELQTERLLREELRVLSSELSDLDYKRISVDERGKILKKVAQDQLREQMKLSMYASVTNIIPNIDDQSKISGHIVERDKRVVEKFEYDHGVAFDTCNNIWKMINL